MEMGGGIANEMWLSDADDHIREAELQRLIWNELEGEPGLDPRDLRVEVSGTVATLSGAAHSYPDKLAAERAADRVRGIQHVVNSITVEPLEADRRTDQALADAAASALAWHVLVPPGRVKVSVEDGVVRLTGQVAAEAQRVAAVGVVSHLRGVREVDDALQIAWTSGEWHLGQRVHEAIARDGRLHGRRIRVQAHGSRVELHGQVRSLAERQEAVEVVRGVPGVTDVVDQLRVRS
jgi:osmotically-inducible protein OsmY